MEKEYKSEYTKMKQLYHNLLDKGTKQVRECVKIKQDILKILDQLQLVLEEYEEVKDEN